MKNWQHFTLKLTASLTLILGAPSSILTHLPDRASAASSKQNTTSKIKSILEKNHVRGSVLVVQDGKSQTVNYGYGNYKNKALNNRVLYPLGSMEKVVTGAMMTQLIFESQDSENPITQDSKLSRWFPKVKGSKNITIGHLMTHTSGINIIGTERTQNHFYSETGAIQWAINEINSTSSSKRDSFNYNNANYLLLAGIIRKVTGKSYDTNLKNRIIKPLKLKNTFEYQDIPKNKTIATSYGYRHGRSYQDPVKVTKALASQLPGAGNLFTTPQDYYKIMQGLYNGKILTPTQYDYMTTLSAKKTTYSGGIYRRAGGKFKVAYGNIGYTHFSNWMELTPDNANGIVIFLNQTPSDNGVAKKVGYKILQTMQDDFFVEG
ncbi:serine hydrolase domain-containing protein [Lactobacillus sp. PV012]|uniref:serine hydrolase domain-containing protein n=1 Tax=Lactobacillus sp. PV012 TaxID=2594494 RepID=UPI00223EDED9|nr:serine hydrolase domain-containing protein [Lactobacillus sp. PV012]QNQ82291.1 beta-lactamase family protein [Lactobacillus sp. PV012]